MLAAVKFAQRVTDADLCLTGEGQLDEQSLAGKACIGVAREAKRHGVPTVALVGALGPGAEQAVQNEIEDALLLGPGLSKAESMRRAPELLVAAAARAVARYC